MSKDTVARHDIKKLGTKIYNLCCKIDQKAEQADLEALQQALAALSLTVNSNELRIQTLEDAYIKVTNFEVISTASGSITIPTGGDILFDQFNGTIDAVVSEIDVSNTPTWQNATTAAGDIITVTSLDSAGNYTLSGTPTGNIAILYVYRVQRKDFDYNQSIGFETLDLTADEIKQRYPRQYKIIADRNNPNVSNQYLRNGANGMSMSLVGETLPYDATLVEIIARTDVNETWTAEVRKNGAITVEDSLSIVATDFAKKTSTVDFNEDDEIQVYLNGTNISRPKVILIFEER